MKDIIRLDLTREEFEALSNAVGAIQAMIGIIENPEVGDTGTQRMYSYLKDAAQIILSWPRDTLREKFLVLRGRDPFVCCYCKGGMDVDSVCPHPSANGEHCVHWRQARAQRDAG
jgi:hypothetical protein